MKIYIGYLLKKQYGMALLEVLVAMLVFALAILPLVRLHVLSVDATKAGYFKTETAAAAQSIMDYLTTDHKGIFNGDWDDVVVTSSAKCANPPGKSSQQVACNILNGESGANNIYAKGNAILCVYGKQDDIKPSSSGGTSEVKLDQHLISIRAIWYSGKRQKNTNGHKFYDKDLAKEDCGASIDDNMNATTLQNENIDSIRIDMAY